MANSAWSVLVGVDFDTSKIKNKLNEAVKGIDFKIDAQDSVKNLDELNSSMEDTSLTFQAANEVFSKSIEIISAMVDQVYELDSALTEFKKVSSLSGSALDDYVSKLSDMGDAVARTGKPKCQAPDVGIGNQHQEPLEIQYSLRAYSTTMVA